MQVCFNQRVSSAPVAAGSERAGPNQDWNIMNPIRFVALALVVGGVLALLYGGFSYTKDSTAVKLGPIELSVKEKKEVNVPVWAGIGAIVVGGALLVLGGKKG